MSSEDFQILDNEPIDNSIIKRENLKVYHQQGTQLNQTGQNIEFISGENYKFPQIGEAYLEFDTTVRKNCTTILHYHDPICLLNNAFAFCFEEAPLSTTIGSDIEHK